MSALITPGRGWRLAHCRFGLLFVVLSLALVLPRPTMAAPATQLAGPSPLIYVPNEGFGNTTFRDSNSYDIRSSSATVANVVAIDHNTDGSLLFLAGTGAGSRLQVFDVSQQASLGTLELEVPGLDPCGVSSVVAVDEGSKAYVACEGNGFVFAINVDRNTGVLTRGTAIFVGLPKALQQVGGLVYVANTRTNTVVRINPLTDEATSVVGAGPFIIDDVAVDGIHGRAYLVHLFNNRILVGNLQTGAIVGEVTFDGQPTDLLVAPDNQRLYVKVDGGNGSDHIAVVEGLGSGEAVAATIPLDQATFLASNDEGTCLFAWGYVQNQPRIHVIDTATNQVSAQPIVAGGGADGDFVAPGASPQAVYLEANADNLNVFTVSEGAGSIQLIVRRGCSSAGTVQVQYNTGAASSNAEPAVTGQDYQPVSGVLTFAPGEVIKTIEVPLVNDNVYGEPDRAFALTLSGPDGAFLGNRFADTIVVQDDDQVPAGADLQISIDDSPDPVSTGAELIYSINVSNQATVFNNPVTAQDVLVTSVLPAGVGFVSAEVVNNPGGGGGGDFFSVTSAALNTPPAEGACDAPPVGQSGPVVCNVGPLNASSNGAFAQITLRVNVLPAAGTTLVNAVSVTTSSFDPYPENNSASASTQVNAAPLANNDSTTTPQNTLVTVNVLANDSDPDNDSLSVIDVSSAANGQATTDGTTVTYTPNAGFSGSDSFSYTISDGRGGTASATVNMTVTPTNGGATRITIVLSANPKANQNVRFTGSGVIGRFFLDDTQPNDGDAYSNSRTFNLAPGSYTFSENVPNNRLLIAINCTGDNTNVNLASATATINLTSGADVTCTFVNESPVTIRGRVYNDRNHNGRRNGNEPFLAGWTFTLYRGNTSAIVASGLTAGATPQVNFTQLPAGSYTLCETLPGGWINSDPATLTQPYNAPCRPVAVTPGQTVTLNFGNYQQTATAAATIDPAGEESVSYEQEAPLADESGYETETNSGAVKLFFPVIEK